MADTKLTGLSEVSVPELEDLLYLVEDPAGTPTSRKVTGSRYAGLLLRNLCEGRLTLESGVPVSSSDQADKSTLYFALYNGNRISLYDGTRWKLYTFTEKSLALSSLTSGKNYDVFLYDNAGTLTLELSAAWTNDTTRADALTTQDGIYVKDGATTRRYLGTIRATDTDKTQDVIGGTTSQVGGKGFVWNLYNRVLRPLRVIDTTDSWTYSVDAFRQMNNNSGNKVEYVAGLNQCMVQATAVSSPYLDTDGDALGIAVGVDSVTVASMLWQQGYVTGSVGVVSAIGMYNGYPGLGYHYLAPLERATVGTVSYFGDNSGAQQSGLVAWVER